ncbi:MAG TPA: hypothetical protein DCO75_09575 [Fibrobacteres bacterium]|nr:hypothetical protein [Fibrobacterota bacterium]
MRLKSKILKIAFIYLWLAGATVFASPDFSMIGYAAVSGDSVTKTTGGTGGTTTTVSTLAGLETWANDREKNVTPAILQISGKISSDTAVVITIKNGANISIVGVGTSAELEHIGLNIRDYSNVIVKYIKIHEVLYPGDALTLDNVRHGWVDHCELHSKIGSGITVDTYDGLLDIKKGSCYITISWCYLHDHMKCSLIGHSDNLNQQEEDSYITVTYHHNWFNNTDGRNPSIRYGAVHMFNNYYSNITDYGLASRDGAHAKVENCHYHNVKLPMSTDKFKDTTSSAGDKIGGYICESGNIFTGTCGADTISQTGCDYWTSTKLSYSYTLDDVNSVAATVEANVGTGAKITVSNKELSSGIASSGRGQLSVKTVVQLSTRGSLAGREVYTLSGSKVPVSSLDRNNGMHGLYIVKNVSNNTAK